ncbi:amidohydrolase family protein [Hwanghaeella sp.]|uniref:metal-dependent hydrolase family protein n=1 Tax=Hwanghaeella sp. TaxID=2605943 RepID=UPI003CCC18A4
MAAENGIILSNATILDVISGDRNEDRHVRIRDGKIIEISDEPLTPEGCDVIDLGGKTLMPGLCDAHVHVIAVTANFPALQAMSPYYVTAKASEVMSGMLDRGFTTVRDAGGADWGLAKAVEEESIEGPRLLYCGHALSQTGGHGDMRSPGQNGLEQCFCCAGMGHVCDGVSAVRKAAREEIRRGATHIKIMASGGVSSPTDRITSTQFSDEEITAIVEEATAANIPVIAHAYTARAVNRALKLGVTSIEHGNLIDEESVDLFKEYDAWLVPTLSTYQALVKEGEDAGMAADLVQKTYEVLDAGIKALEMAYWGGVKIAYGTDLLGIMHRHQLNEFTIRAEVCPPMEVIRQATIYAADLFGMKDQIGQVTEGFLADLIVVDGDPVEDITVMTQPDRHLKMVMKGGKILRRAD